jgi:hypothetical protein
MTLGDLPYDWGAFGLFVTLGLADTPEELVQRFFTCHFTAYNDCRVTQT